MFGIIGELIAVFYVGEMVIQVEALLGVHLELNGRLVGWWPGETWAEDISVTVKSHGWTPKSR